MVVKVNLEITHHRSAKWKDDTWDVSDKPSYKWTSKTEQSPSFDALADALNWIIEHDEQATLRSTG
jgi:hypothetical protein